MDLIRRKCKKNSVCIFNDFNILVRDKCDGRLAVPELIPKLRLGFFAFKGDSDLGYWTACLRY